MKEIKQFDVIVLGGGLAGIYTALNIRSDLKIGLFIKDKIDVGSSNLAQGGIAAETIFSPKQMEEHFEDTLRAGGYHNDKKSTQILVDEAPQNIDKDR